MITFPRPPMITPFQMSGSLPPVSLASPFIQGCTLIRTLAVPRQPTHRPERAQLLPVHGPGARAGCTAPRAPEQRARRPALQRARREDPRVLWAHGRHVPPAREGAVRRHQGVGVGCRCRRCTETALDELTTLDVDDPASYALAVSAARCRSGYCCCCRYCRCSLFFTHVPTNRVCSTGGLLSLVPHQCSLPRLVFCARCLTSGIQGLRAKIVCVAPRVFDSPS